MSDEKQTFIRYASTDKAGAYKVSVGSDLIAMFAVQMDPAESDVRRADPEVIAALENVKREESTSTASPMVVTKEFWTPLIWIVAAIFVMEALMAHRISYARLG